MTSASTTTESVPTDGRPPVGPYRAALPVWPIAAVVAVVASLMVAMTVRIPYYAIAPGAAVDVAPLVRVVSGPNYPPRGQIFLCTVSLEHTTILQALQGWLDPTIDVVQEKAIVPPHVAPSKLNEIGLQQMDTSKEKALGVAFEALGYHAITGKGAEVAEVGHGTAADGLLHSGDTIIAVDGAKVELDAQAVKLVGKHHPGDAVKLSIEAKDGARREVTATLRANPADPKRPFLGVILTTNTPSFHFPYKVEIGSEQIGGPSAGLAFTLEVLDVLTPGELTGGHKVAATGTMELDGSVGDVGGVAQKTLAVKAAGVHLFLVPANELAQARKFAGKDLRVEPVRNLQDALRILASIGGNGLALDRAGHAGA